MKHTQTVKASRWWFFRGAGEEAGPAPLICVEKPWSSAQKLSEGQMRTLYF